jgi:hypothetical protein
MRRAAILALLLLAACKPSFDDRYDKAEKDIRAQASADDSELAKQQAAAPPASDTPTPTPSTPSEPPAR